MFLQYRLNSPTPSSKSLVTESGLAPARPPGGGDAQLLCRTYIDTPREDSADLIASHPSSSQFWSFFTYKFLFYLLCLLIVAMQIVVTYPSLYGALKLSALDSESAPLMEKVLYVILSAALVACRLTWIAGIYKVIFVKVLIWKYKTFP